MAVTITRNYTQGELKAAQAAYHVLVVLNAEGNNEDLLAYGDLPVWKAAERTLWLIYKQVTGSAKQATQLLDWTIECGEAGDALAYWKEHGVK